LHASRRGARSALGILNVIYGIAAIGDSKFFVADQNHILSGLHRIPAAGGARPVEGLTG